VAKFKTKGIRLLTERYLGRPLTNKEFSDIIDEWKPTAMALTTFLRTKKDG